MHGAPDMRIDQFPAIRQFNFADTLREHSRSRPNMIASVDGPERLTYRQLDCRVNKVADGLRKRGVGPGDRIMWVGQNSARVMELLLACAKIGAQLCPANWRVSPPEFADLVHRFDPKIVFWQDIEVGDIYHVNKETWKTHDRQWVQHDGTGADCYEALIESGEDHDPETFVDADTPLLAIYTAAFDGAAKAAQLSHNAILLQALLSARGQAIDETSSYLMSGPMFHVGVLMGGFAAFVAGGRCVYVRRVDAAELLDLVEREHVSHAYLPGPVVDQMMKLDAAGKRDLSSLFPSRDLKDWAPPLAIPEHAPMRHHMGQYGQTELMGSVVLAWLGGSGAGRPGPFLQIRLLDEAGREVPDGETGEIAARGPLVMNGYYGADAVNQARSADGWYRTNDLGRRNPDGSLSFVGPKATMIKSGLENIYPAEVEACIRALPEVSDVCVIGVPDERWAQSVKAVVVLNDTAALDEHAVIEHCRHAIASYKKPKIVAFAPALPRLPNGFVDRAAVDAGWGGGGYPKVG
ncbi:AMP-binding protein [Novosphingobium resinovorum]|nr:AMP-binding protein [Novosphingobium resinovorum]